MFLLLSSWQVFRDCGLHTRNQQSGWQSGSIDRDDQSTYPQARWPSMCPQSKKTTTTTLSKVISPILTTTQDWHNNMYDGCSIMLKRDSHSMYPQSMGTRVRCHLSEALTNENDQKESVSTETDWLARTIVMRRGWNVERPEADYLVSAP